MLFNLLVILGLLMLALFVVVQVFSRYKPEVLLIHVIYAIVFLPKTIYKIVLGARAWLKNPAPIRRESPPKTQQQTRINWDTETQNEIEQFALSFAQLRYQKKIPKLNTQNKLVDFLRTTWGYQPKKRPKDKALLTLRKIMLPPVSGETRRDIREAMAAQIVDTAMLTLCIHKLGIFMDSEAWGLLLLNAQKAQDCFASWTDFCTCLAQNQPAAKVAGNTTPAARLAAYEKIQQNLPAWPVEPAWQLQITDIKDVAVGK